MTPGLHIFFKGRVGEPDQGSNGSSSRQQGLPTESVLTVDPRVRPEIIKSLDPETGRKPV